MKTRNIQPRIKISFAFQKKCFGTKEPISLTQDSKKNVQLFSFNDLLLSMVIGHVGPDRWVLDRTNGSHAIGYQNKWVRVRWGK